MSNSSTDDRDDNQQFINGQVEEMLERLRKSHAPIQSKMKNLPEERSRRRQFSLVPEVFDEFSEKSFSKVEIDSQGSNSLEGFDDNGYSSDKNEIESPLENFGGFQINQPMQKTKTMIPNYGNPFQSASYLKKMLSDASDNDDVRLKISNNNFKSPIKEFTPTMRPFRRQQKNSVNFPQLQKIQSQYSAGNHTLGR